MVAARGKSLTTYVDGVLVNQLTDDSCDRGGVGLNMWRTTAARFRDPGIRHYHKCRRTGPRRGWMPPWI